VSRGSMRSPTASEIDFSCFPWYGIRTRSNCEKIAATVLEAKGYEQYLPVQRVRRCWSDRFVETTLPLFPGYVFCRFDSKYRTPIVSTPGVLSVVSFGNEPAAILDSEIGAIRTLLSSGLPSEPCPFLCKGQRIRIKRGSLQGVEGILTKRKSEWRIIISITMLQRSVAVEVDRDSVTAF
jgi:transcription antitermination factor NusG